MKLPALTFDRLRQAQLDHAREPYPWQAVYCEETSTLARIQRDAQGRIVYFITEGPLDPEMAEARMAEIMSEPLPGVLQVPAGVARH